MDIKSYKLSKNYTNKEVTRIVNRETDSDAMSKQAAVNAYGVDKGNLKARIDDDYNKMKQVLDSATTQLAVTATKAEVVAKADKTYVDAELNSISFAQINKNLVKLDQTYMTDEFLQQIVGEAPVNSTPANNSLTTSMFTDGSVTLRTLIKYDDYLIDTDYILVEGSIADIDGTDTVDTRRMRFKNITLIKKGTLLSIHPDYLFVIYKYNSDGTYVGYLNNGYIQSHEFLENTYCRITIKHKSGNAFTEDLNVIARRLSTYSFDLLSAMKAKEGGLLSPVNFERGAFSDTTGLHWFALTTSRVRTKDFLKLNNDTIFKVINNTYKFLVYEYDVNSNFIKYVDVPDQITLTKDKKYQLVIRRLDNGTIINKNDAISALSTQELNSADLYKFDNTQIWEYGSFYDATGLPAPDVSRLRTSIIIKFSKGSILTSFSSAYEFVLYEFDYGGNYISYIDGGKTVYDFPSDKYCKVLLRRRDKASFTESKEEIIKKFSLLIDSTVDKYVYEKVNNAEIIGVKKDASTQIISHRGDVNYAPENTMSAFRLAVSKGAKYLECDISKTSDGEFIVLHDTTIDRTSNGSGFSTSYTLAQLQEYDFGSWFSPIYAGEKIPSLKELLMYCKIYNLHLELDLKDGYFTSAELASIIDLVKKCSMLQRTCFTGNSTTLKTVLSSVPNATVSIAGITSIAKVDEISFNTKYNTIYASVPINNLTEGLCNHIHQNGMYVKTWTSNSVSGIKNAINLGADWVLSDNIYWSDVY